MASTDTGGSALTNLYLNWMVVVLAFSLPVYRKWVSIAVPLILLLWLIEGRFQSKVQALRKSPLTAAILAFIALNLFSLLWSSFPADGFSYVMKYGYLLLVPVVATSLRPAYRKPAQAAFAAGTTVATVLLLATSLGLLQGVEATRGNPSVTMSHLDFSIVLAVACLLGLNHLLLAPLNLRQRVWRSAVLALWIVGLFVNIGRSGQLAFFATLLLITPFYLKGRRWWRMSFAALLVGALFTMVYTGAPVFHERVDSALNEFSKAARGEDFDTNQGKRVAGMIVAAQIVKSDPILGTGPIDNMVEFRALLESRFQHLIDAVAWFPHFHNQYVQVATELGLVGLLALLNLFVQLFRNPFPDRESRMGAIILGSVFLFGFAGDPYFHKQMTVALFGCAAGVLTVGVFSCWSDNEGPPLIDAPLAE